MNEHLFQYIWSNLYFDFRYLKTINDEEITIINKGVLNHGDGPDFLDAIIKVDNLTFHGAIELHLYAKDWFQHNHHNDERYNNVILHVVLFEKELCPVTRSDGTQPFTLLLKPYIASKVQSIFINQNQHHGLACSGFLKKVPGKIIRDQFHKSRTRYFEYKTDQLISYYNHSYDVWLAWRNAIAYGLFDGLGISANREPMRELCSLLLQKDDWKKLSALELSEYLWKLSGLSPDSGLSQLSKNNWSFSGTRPRNQPNIRIRQAANLMYNLNQIATPFSTTMTGSVWEQIINNDSNEFEPIGSERLNILYTTVYLPSLYLLGNQLNIHSLKKKTLKTWENTPIHLPQKISGKFKSTGLDSAFFKNHSGVIFQYKHYCEGNNCQDCNIMKYALKT